MKTLIVALILTLTKISFASEIHWITVNTNLRYVDSTLSCDNFSLSGIPLVDGTANLSLEVEGDKVIKAQLNNLKKNRPLRLSRTETNSMRVFREKKGAIYLEKWTASEETLKWLGYFPTELSYCHPSLPFKTIAPNVIHFNFETEGLAEGIEVSYSNWFNFTGVRLDNKAYQLNLQLVQRKYTR